MNAEISVFVICVKTIICLLLYNFHGYIFNANLNCVFLHHYGRNPRIMKRKKICFSISLVYFSEINLMRFHSQLEDLLKVQFIDHTFSSIIIASKVST